MNKNNHSPRLFFWSRVVSIGAIIVVVLFASYGFYLVDKVDTMQQQWVEYNQKFTKIANQLQKLHDALGYGGLIHDFKNYVLRFNGKYEKRTQEAFLNSRQALDDLNNSLTEPTALRATEEIKRTINEYYQNYQNLRQLGNQELDIAYRDQFVKVNDEAAFKALAYLRQYIVKKSEHQQQQTNMAVENVLSFFYRGAWFAPMLLIVVLMMNLLMGRLRASYLEVQAAHNFIDNLISQSPDALIVLKPDGKIIRTNNKASELFGYQEEEFKTLHIQQLIPELYNDEQYKLRAEYADSENTSYPVSQPIPIPTKDGQLPICEIAFRSNGKGENRVITASARDVTEREKTRIELKEAKFRAEVNLKRLQEAQESLVRSEKLASLGGLVAGIAHEINTPVGTTVTAASHLEEETKSIRKLYENEDLSAEELEEYFSICDEATRLICINCNRAAELIQSFKQVAVDQTSEEHRQFDLKNYIDEIVLSLRPKLKNLPHQIEINCPEHLILNSYPGLLSQLLSNLILNSINHAWEEGDEGIIQIIVSQPDDNKIQMIYHDNGKGIPIQNQDKIFDPFFTTKRGSGGSGLGLHILHNLIYQRLGGELSLSSQENMGTTFTITLPQCI